jgi:hypothetical protein
MISVMKRKEERINSEEMEPPICGFRLYELSVAGIADKSRNPEMMVNKVTV